MAIHKAVVEAAAKASESYVQKAREKSAAAAVGAGGDAAEAKKEARGAALASGCIIETLSPMPNIQVNAADIPVEATKYKSNAKKRGRGRPRQNVDPFVGPFEEPSKRCCRPLLGIQGTKRRHGDSGAQKQPEVSIDADMPDDRSTNMEVRMGQLPSHFAMTNGITDDVAEIAASILAERDAKKKIDAPSVVPVSVHVEGVPGGYELDGGMEESSEEEDEWIREVAEV